MSVVELQDLDLVTPNGRPVRFTIRRDTNDQNTVFSLANADEYGLRGLSLEGWALDLGGHVGGVGICLALDNPGLHSIVVVEPVPDNAELIRRNADLNGVGDRVEVIEAAAGPAGAKTEIRFGFRDEADGYEHHAWIGNTSLIHAGSPPAPHDALEVSCLDLLELAATYGEPPAIVKVDCEGGEWGALPQLVELGSPRIVGEWHACCGRERVDEIRDAFEAAGYQFTATGPIGGPGGFTATR